PRRARRPRPRPYRRVLPQARPPPRRARAGRRRHARRLAERGREPSALRAGPLPDARRARVGPDDAPAPRLRGGVARGGRRRSHRGARRRRACDGPRLCRPDRRLLLHPARPGRQPGRVLVRPADRSATPSGYGADAGALNARAARGRARRAAKRAPSGYARRARGQGPVVVSRTPRRRSGGNACTRMLPPRGTTAFAVRARSGAPRANAGTLRPFCRSRSAPERREERGRENEVSGDAPLLYTTPTAAVK